MEQRKVEKNHVVNCQDSVGAVNPQGEWQGCLRSIRVGSSRQGTSHHPSQEQEIQGELGQPQSWVQSMSLGLG